MAIECIIFPLKNLKPLDNTHKSMCMPYPIYPCTLLKAYAVSKVGPKAQKPAGRPRTRCA